MTNLVYRPLLEWGLKRGIKFHRLNRKSDIQIEAFGNIWTVITSRKTRPANGKELLSFLHMLELAREPLYLLRTDERQMYYISKFSFGDNKFTMPKLCDTSYKQVLELYEEVIARRKEEFSQFFRQTYKYVGQDKEVLYGRIKKGMVFKALSYTVTEENVYILLLIHNERHDSLWVNLKYLKPTQQPARSLSYYEKQTN